MPDKSDISALIGSRICHDLISPIGAIGNGVELLMMDGLGKSPELQLILDSVASANARVRFFRIAFGAAGPNDQKLSSNEMRDILLTLGRGGRTRIDWHPEEPSARREVKLVFLMILCLETALPLGGKIEIMYQYNRWNIRGTGSKIRVERPLWDLLADPTLNPDVSPAEVHFPILREELSRQHRRLSTKIDQGEISFSL